MSNRTVIAFPEEDAVVAAQYICPRLIDSNCEHGSECPKMSPPVTVVICAPGCEHIVEVDSVHGLVKALLMAAQAEGDVKISFMGGLSLEERY